MYECEECGGTLCRVCGKTITQEQRLYMLCFWCHVTLFLKKWPSNMITKAHNERKRLAKSASA